MSALLQDLRYSVRLFLKTPGFTLTAVLVLALGIGANAAVFALVNGLLFKPLAWSERPARVVGIYSHDRTRADSYRGFSYPAFADVRDGATAFSDVAGFTVLLLGSGGGGFAGGGFAGAGFRRLLPGRSMFPCGNGLSGCDAAFAG